MDSRTNSSLQQSMVAPAGGGNLGTPLKPTSRHRSGVSDGCAPKRKLTITRFRVYPRSLKASEYTTAMLVTTLYVPLNNQNASATPAAKCDGNGRDG